MGKQCLKLNLKKKDCENLYLLEQRKQHDLNLHTIFYYII